MLFWILRAGSKEHILRSCLREQGSIFPAERTPGNVFNERGHVGYLEHHHQPHNLNLKGYSLGKGLQWWPTVRDSG
eukprot:1138302-Pelagomonas_calceolata.AAC.9